MRRGSSLDPAAVERNGRAAAWRRASLQGGRLAQRVIRWQHGVVKVAAEQYGDRKVYSVSAFNRGAAGWLARSSRRSGSRARSRSPETAAGRASFCTPTTRVTAPACPCRCRAATARLRLTSGTASACTSTARALRGQGRPPPTYALDRTLWARRSPSRGAGEASYSRARRALRDRAQTTPRFPHAPSAFTGNDAAAKRRPDRDHDPLPSACVVVAETYVQGLRAAPRARHRIGRPVPRGPWT